MFYCEHVLLVSQTCDFNRGRYRSNSQSFLELPLRDFFFQKSMQIFMILVACIHFVRSRSIASLVFRFRNKKARCVRSQNHLVITGECFTHSLHSREWVSTKLMTFLGKTIKINHNSGVSTVWQKHPFKLHKRFLKEFFLVPVTITIALFTEKKPLKPKLTFERTDNSKILRGKWYLGIYMLGALCRGLNPPQDPRNSRHEKHRSNTALLLNEISNKDAKFETKLRKKIAPIFLVFSWQVEKCYPQISPNISHQRFQIANLMWPKIFTTHFCKHCNSNRDTC